MLMSLDPMLMSMLLMSLDPMLIRMLHQCVAPAAGGMCLSDASTNSRGRMRVQQNGSAIACGSRAMDLNILDAESTRRVETAANIKTNLDL